MVQQCLVIVVFVFSLLPGCHGKVSSGHVVTREDWIFLDRFCFLSAYGRFDYEIQFDLKKGIPSLLMYPDIQWNDDFGKPNTKSCEAKNSVLNPWIYQILALTPDNPESGCEYVHRRNRRRRRRDNNSTKPILSAPTTTGTKLVTTYDTHVICTSTRSFDTARERWWFIAVSNCNASQGLDFEYKFKMTNGRQRDYWYEHFSADEFYILPCLTSFTFTYLFLLFLGLIFAVELKCRQLLHVTYKLFLASIGMQTLGVMCLAIAYARFGTTGTMLTQLKLTGRILEAFSEFLLILLILLLGKGYTVTRARLRVPSAVKLTVFLCFYFLLYTFLFFFQQYFFEPWKVLYIYQSPPGYGLLFLRILGWLMFLYGIIFTLKHFPEKGSFYFPFVVIYSLWFISGPIVIILANHLIDSWVREKTAIIVEHLATFIAHIVFLFLTRPSAANQSFPYHVRTTQVGADLTSSTEPLDRFENHSYAPSTLDTTGRTVDVFTVRGVIQRLEPMEVFSATASSDGPIMFRAMPPKYSDVFPHETPGEVAEMLKEPEEVEGSGSDLDSSQTSPYHPANGASTSTREAFYAVPPSPLPATKQVQ